MENFLKKVFQTFQKLLGKFMLPFRGRTQFAPTVYHLVSVVGADVLDGPIIAEILYFRGRGGVLSLLPLAFYL